MLTTKARAMLAIALAPLLWAAVQAAQTRTVTEREAAIRAAKLSYAKKLAAVKEGEQVTLISEQPPWIEVKHKDVQGFMTISSVTEKKQIVLSTSEAARGVTTTEQTAAARGFSPEIEREYRTQNPDLEAAFRTLDELEKKRADEAQVIPFLVAGRLASEQELGR